MKHYDDLTPALQATLLSYGRGYTLCVTFEIEREKLQAIEQKFIDVYGISLPAWKRHERKRLGLPNAWACSMPSVGAPHRVCVVLLRTDADLAKLDPANPWAREKWSQKVEIGDFFISADQRDRGDFTTTWKLTPRCLKGLEAYWRSLAGQGNFDQLVWDIQRAARFYPMFGGIRRQLRRLIRGYAKLYVAKKHRDWPGPDPENLPVMTSFLARANGAE